MTSIIEQLAPGSYDVLNAGIAIAAMGRIIPRGEPSDTRQIELSNDVPASAWPAPSTSQWLTFKPRSAAPEWLGIRDADPENGG